MLRQVGAISSGCEQWTRKVRGVAMHAYYEQRWLRLETHAVEDLSISSCSEALQQQVSVGKVAANSDP